ncbi:hypothetical protein FHG87_011198 [Trinorchestia longiramus]|nr:hypothetical protein FHG87_011198 [Trinorchestia longiramus]
MLERKQASVCLLLLSSALQLLPSSSDLVSKCCKSWLSSLQSRHPQRLYICCSYAMTGVLTPLDRFLAPIPPPSLASATESPDQLQCRVAWFVSLLPALPDMSLLSDCLNITASCDAFVSRAFISIIH